MTIKDGGSAAAALFYGLEHSPVGHLVNNSRELLGDGLKLTQDAAEAAAKWDKYKPPPVHSGIASADINRDSGTGVHTGNVPKRGGGGAVRAAGHRVQMMAPAVHDFIYNG